IRGDAADALDPVTRDEDVQPAIVVVIKEPGRKAERGSGHTQLLGHICEMPFSLGRLVGTLWAVIPIKVVGLAATGDVEVGPAVVVKIKPGGGLGGMQAEQAGGFGHVIKGAVAVVAQE